MCDGTQSVVSCMTWTCYNTVHLHDLPTLTFALLHKGLMTSCDGKMDIPPRDAGIFLYRPDRTSDVSNTWTMVTTAHVHNTADVTSIIYGSPFYLSLFFLPFSSLCHKTRAEKARQHLFLQVNLLLKPLILVKSISPFKIVLPFADSFSFSLDMKLLRGPGGSLALLSRNLWNLISENVSGDTVSGL